MEPNFEWGPSSLQPARNAFIKASNVDIFTCLHGSTEVLMGQRRAAGGFRGEQVLIGLLAGQYRPDGETFAARHNGKHDSFPAVAPWIPGCRCWRGAECLQEDRLFAEQLCVYIFR